MMEGREPASQAGIQGGIHVLLDGLAKLKKIVARAGVTGTSPEWSPGAA